MGTIPGPIIRFVIDTPGLSAAITPAMTDIKNQARAASESVAESWRVTAAKIRAELSSGVASQREMNVERERLLGTLNSEIRSLQQRNELSTRELSNLKAMTLERERQLDAIKRGVGVGVTSGTSSALGQVSTQATLGIERIVDSVVNRYLGGAAGALTRTVRDVSYYANQASGGTGGGIFGLSGTALGTAAAAAALVGVGTALTGIAIKGGQAAVEITKLSEKTGLTVDEVIKLRSAADALDSDFDKVTIGFRKFSSELTLASSADLPGASKSAKEAAALFKALGVNVKLAAQDPFAAIQTLSKTLGSLPDGFVKTNASTVLFGRGGMELIPVFDKLNPAMAATAKSSKDLADAITGGKGAVESSEALRAQIINFKNETESLEIALSKKLLPTLVSVTDWINSHWKYLTAGFSPFGLIYGGDEGEGRAKGLAIPSFADLNKFLDSGDTSKKLKDVADALAKVGDGSEEAAKHARAAAKEFESWQKMLTSGPEYKKSAGYITNRHDEVMDQVLGRDKPPEFPFTFSPIPLGISTTAPKSILDQLKAVNDEYTKEMQSETDKIKAEYDSQFEYWKTVQAAYPQVAKQTADAIIKLQEEENKKLADLQDKAFEKYKKDADSLFDDLLSGKGKSFTKALEKDIEDIITQPTRKMFDDIIGKMLQGLDQAVNGKTGSGTGASSGSNGGILGPILSRIGIGGTAGTFPGSTGLGKTGTGTVAIQSGQTGVMTQTMNVTANVVNIDGGTGSGGSGIPALGSNLLGGSSSQFGTFFGNLNPFGGGASFFGNLNPFGGSSSAASQNAGAGQALGGLLLAGLGIKGGSASSTAFGSAALATGLAKIFGASNATTIGNPGPNGPQNLGQQLAGIFSGGAMLGTGLSQPGFSGELSDIAGGATIGSMFGPIGTAIGTIAGGIAGLVKGIFGGKSWAQRVQSAMTKGAVYKPPSETFDFAMGNSMSDTFSTGFSQSGDTFSNFQLGANTPFWANSIYGPLSKKQQQQLANEQAGLIPGQPFLGLPSTNPFVGQGPIGRFGSSTPNISVNFNLPGLMDQSAANAVFTQHAPMIARLVGAQLPSSASGFGHSVRSAVALP